MYHYHRFMEMAEEEEGSKRRTFFRVPNLVEKEKLGQKSSKKSQKCSCCCWAHRRTKSRPEFVGEISKLMIMNFLFAEASNDDDNDDNNASEGGWLWSDGTMMESERKRKREREREKERERERERERDQNHSFFVRWRKDPVILPRNWSSTLTASWRHNVSWKQNRAEK